MIFNHSLMRWYTSYKSSVLVPSGWRRQRCEQTDSAGDDRLIRGGALVGVVYRAGPAITIGTAAGASPKDGRQSRSHPRMVVKVVEATVNYCSRHTLLDLLLPWLECIASVKCTSKCRGCVGVCGGLVNYKFAFVRDSATVFWCGLSHRFCHQTTMLYIAIHCNAMQCNSLQRKSMQCNCFAML